MKNTALCHGFRWVCPMVLMLPLGSVHASGFALIEQSASGQGNAFSGASTAAEDASVIYFNPAAMTLFRTAQSTLSLHVINPTAGFSNQGSALASSLGPLGGALSGPDDDGSRAGVVPNLYYLRPMNRDVVLGVGINAPFGLSTEYNRNWVGRYHAVKSELNSVNINPSIAWRLDDRWSVGAGLSAQYVDVTLTSAVDLGSVCVASEGAGLIPTGTCGSVGAGPQKTDGFAEISGNDWGYGFNLGLLFEAAPDSRIGLSYRSRIAQNISGDATFTVPSRLSFLQSSGKFVNTTARAGMTLPETVSLGYYREMSRTLAVMADWTWTRWSRFQELRIDYDSAQADSVTTEHWRNTHRFSLGANYRLNQVLLLRAGLAYDQTPIPSAARRTARIPGNTRRWLSLGLGWAMTPASRLDVGYSHLFVANTPINNRIESSVPALQHTLSGSYDASVDILSAQMVWRY